MAWEKIRSQANSAAILHKLESTAGTDASPALGTDDASFLAFSWRPRVDLRGRPIINPYGPGAAQSVGLALIEFNGQLDFQAGAISAADGTDDHSLVTAARYCGWTVVRNATDKTITLFAEPLTNATATIYAARGVVGASEYNQTRLRGAMANWQIDYSAGGGLLFSVNNGQAEMEVADFSTVGSALTGTLLNSDGIVKAESATVRLYDPAAGTLFGGGTLASPNAALQLVSYRLTGNRTIGPLPGVSGDFGVAEFGPSLNGLVQGSLALWAPKYSDWNVFSQILNETKLYLGVDFPTPGASGTTTRIAHYLQVTGGALRDLDSISVLDIDFIAQFPADVSDNDPAAGANPSQKWAAGTNIGLIDDTSISASIPEGAPVFIQTHTT